MGDIVMTAFFSPSKAGRIIWGVGPVVLLPTATDNALGSEKFGIGPSVVLLTQPGKWTLGAPVQSDLVDERRQRPRGRQPDLPAAVCQLQPGKRTRRRRQSWRPSGNWNADETWTAPLLFNVSKVTLLGKRPVNLVVAAGPMIASPIAGASWRFRMAATFLFPR